LRRLSPAARDAQQVLRGLGMKVPERHHFIVFVDDLGRALVAGDATELAAYKVPRPLIGPLTAS
jgi:hypothetical protein